jgi:hypothetical protein
MCFSQALFLLANGNGTLFEAAAIRNPSWARILHDRAALDHSVPQRNSLNEEKVSVHWLFLVGVENQSTRGKSI